MKRLKYYSLFLFLIFCLMSSADASNRLKEDSFEKKPLMRIEINPKEGAKLFHSGMLIAPSVGGRFEIFKTRINGARERILTGPSLETSYGDSYKILDEVYTIKGKDQNSKSEYAIEYKIVNDNEFVVSFDFKINSQIGTAVSFEIITLFYDLFRGLQIESAPLNRSDLDSIPTEIRSLEKRFLIKNKNTVKIKGPFFGIEITDLIGSNSIGVADFRNVDWAQFKGLYFYGGKRFLLPGEASFFSYRIRLLPLSRILSPKKNYLQNMVRDNRNTLLAKLPKIQVLKPETYDFPKNVSIFGNSNGTAEKILHRYLLTDYGISSDISPMLKNNNRAGIYIRKSTIDDQSLQPEGFTIDVKKKTIEIIGADDRGCLYGVWALLELINTKNKKSFVSTGTIKDWPDVHQRGLCMVSDFIPTGKKDINLYKRYLDAVSRCRGNFIVFYHKPSEIYRWLKGEVSPKYWSRDEMLEIAQYARFLHLDVWAGMTSKFEKKEFPELEVLEGTNLYDPMDKQSYRFIFSLYVELINLYHPSHFLIGHDEIKGLNLYAAKYNAIPSDIFLESVIHLNDWLAERGIKTVVWGDMLLSNKEWGKVAPPANSENVSINSGATHLCMNKIPRNIIIFDWHYIEKKSYTSIEFFKKNGFQVIGASYHAPQAACSMAKNIMGFDGCGVVATNWGFWRTLSPAATSLYTLLCAWTSGFSFTVSEEDVDLLRSLLKPTSTHGWKAQNPVNMESVLNNTLEDTLAGDGKGFLDIGPALDLRRIPTGLQRFGDINFYLHCSEKLSCLILSGFKKENNLNRPITIPIGKPFKADAIAFLHTFFENVPSSQVEIVGRYLIEYVDGHREKIELVKGWNITDIRSDPGIKKNPWPFKIYPKILIGSEIAWDGKSLAGIDLNLQKLLFKNPLPNKFIKTIHIILDDKLNNSKLVLLAVTALTE